jgi:hypothetical protein
MKVLMAILILVLMIGVTPAFAADSPADQQVIAPTAVKETNNDMEDGLSVTDQPDDGQVDPLDETSGYTDGYDDNGDYIGNYIVIDSSDLSGEDGDYSKELDEGNDYTVIDSSDISDQSDEVTDDYSDESDESSYNQVNSDESNDIDDYILVDSSDISDQPDDNGDYIDLLTDEQLDEIGDYAAFEIDNEFEPWGIDQLDGSFEDSADESDDGDYIVIDLNDESSETISQIDTDLPIDTGEPILVTLVNELCGVVQSTLEGVDTICAVLGNELEMIL